MPRHKQQVKKDVPHELLPLILAALTVARQMLEDEAKQARTEPTPETWGSGHDR